MFCSTVRENIDWNHPPWPGTMVTICVSYFTTGSPGREHRTNKPPPTRRVRERSKGDTTCPTTSQNPRWRPSWLSNMHHQKGPWVRMIGRRQPGNSFHLLKTRDCEPRGQAVLLGSLTLLFSAQVPLLNKVSCLVSLCVSSENSFLSVRQEPWKGSPFLQQFFSNLLKTKDTTFKKAKIAFFKKKLIFIFGFSGSLLLCADFL